MITEQIKDNNGNVIYEAHDDGYKEYNRYNENGKLIQSRQHYSNGIVETERWNED